MNDLVPIPGTLKCYHQPDFNLPDTELTEEPVDIGLPALVVVKGLARADRSFHRLNVGDNLAQVLMDLSPDRWGGGGVSVFRNCLSRHSKIEHEDVPDVIVAGQDLFIAYVGPADPITAGVLAAVVIGGSAGIIGGVAVGLAVGAVVLGGAAIGMFLFEQPKIATPESPGDQGSGRGTLGIPRNQARLSSRIPDIFGRIRTWPDLIAPAIDYYNGADFTLDVMYCLGVGDLNYDTPRFGETDVSRFPGASVTHIYPDISQGWGYGVLYSADQAAGFKLNLVEDLPDGSNESQTWSPWVELPGNDTSYIWIDVAFPGGLIQYRTGGETTTQWVDFECQFRRLLSPGVYGGTTTEDFRITGKINGSARYTRVLPFGGSPLASSGVYEVRLRKKGRQGSSDNIHQHDCEVGRFASHRTKTINHKLFNVRRTYLKLHVESTRQAGQQSFEDFNVIAKRLLPILEHNGTPTGGETRRWCDALAHMLMDPYTGGYAFAELDRTTILQVQATTQTLDAGQGGEFNHIYDRFLDVDEQLQSCANAVRASVVQDYGTVTVCRDEVKTVISGLITPQNRSIDDEGSKTISFLSPDENDGVELEWFDAANDYVKRIYRYPSNKTLYNPRKVEIVGLTNWSQVYRRAKFESLKQYRRRRTNTITTFEEGLLLLPMDLVEVVELWDTQRTSEITGYVASATPFQSYILVTPKIDVNPNDYLVVSARNGQIVDQINIIANTSVAVNQIFLERPIAYAPAIVGEGQPGNPWGGTRQVGSRVAIYSTARHEANRWLIGTIKPGDNKCTITLIEYDSFIYSGDGDALPVNPKPR